MISSTLAFFLAFTSVGVFADLELRVKPSGESHVKAVAGAIVFTCEVAGTSKNGVTEDYQIKWFGTNNAEITDKAGRLYVEDEETNVKKLYITGIESQDHGRYLCSGMIDGVKQEKFVKLEVIKDITFDSAITPQHPALNTDALITCQVSGQPTPEISWKFKGKRINFEQATRYQKDPKGLRILNATQEDDGEYICRAEVEFDGRYDERKINVAVHIPPKISDGPGNTEGIEGDELSIWCKATGLPDPTFEFYKEKNDAALETTSRIIVDSKIGSVLFKPLKKEDEGKYTCKVSNDVGEDKIEGQIKVLVKPSIYDLKNISQTEGQRATLDCKSHGDPLPNMTFFKAGREEAYAMGDNEDNRIVVKNSSPSSLQLTIESLVPEDTGSYICKSINTIGRHEQSASLTVNYRPRFAKDHNKVVYIWAGKTRNITCEVQAEPTPNIVWLRGDQTIANNSTYSIYTSGRTSYLGVSVLETDQSWIYGKIICKAGNDLGDDELVIDLRRATVPDAPRQIKVKEAFPTGFLLEVNPPEEDGGEKISGYQVEYIEKDKIPTSVNIGNDSNTSSASEQPAYESNIAAVEVIDANQIRIDNLKPNTEYKLKVKAKNEVGTGSPYEITAKTDTIRRPYPIKIKPETQGEAFVYRIRWDKPNSGGLPIESYEFQYREVKPKDDKETEVVNNPWTNVNRHDNANQPMLHFDLENLKPNSRYHLQIRAKNSEGWSDFSEQIEFKTREATPADLSESKVPMSVGSGTIVAIVFILLIFILVAVDVSCYFLMNCGLTKFILVHVCGRSNITEKEKAMEEGESKEILKTPIEVTAENNVAVQDGQPSPPYEEKKEDCKITADETEPEKVKIEEMDDKEHLKSAIPDNEEKDESDEKLKTETETIKNDDTKDAKEVN